MGERVQLAKGPFPGFAGIQEAVIDPEGGWLDARACLAALEERAVARGATIRRGVGATTVRADRIDLADGKTIAARRVLVAAGFHAPHLFPALRSRIRVTRQPELFFEARADFPDIPTFAAFEEGFYGFPKKDGAIKIADHRKGPTVVDIERRPPATPQEIETARAWMRRRMPELASRPLARERVCLYDNTADDHFILGDAGGVGFAAGLSGHGFKFGPALGEELLALK
jgi:sarcosine oxidase